MVQLLIKIAIVLFGNNWQSALAGELGVADRTLRRWIAGTAPVPLGIWYEVKNRMFNRSVELDRMRTRLSGLLPDTRTVLLQPIPNTRPEVDIGGIRFVLKRPDDKIISCYAQRSIFGDLGVGLPKDMLTLFEQCSDSFHRAASVKFELREFDDKFGMILEPSDVIVLPNPQTRTATLRRYGVVDHAELAVRAVKPDDGLWRVAINAEGNPLTALDAGGALKLADELLAIGQGELAAEIKQAAQEARAFQMQGR